MLVVAKRSAQEYEAALAAGTWHEGVILFPSGDVVIRDRGLVSKLDKTIESVYFSRADVEQRCALHRCGMRRYLKLYYLGIDATAAVISICETDLRDDVGRIAEIINEQKVSGARLRTSKCKRYHCLIAIAYNELRHPLTDVQMHTTLFAVKVDVKLLILRTTSFALRTATLVIDQSTP